jgi:hypothetical protein
MLRLHSRIDDPVPELDEAFLASHSKVTYVIKWPRVHKKWLCPAPGCYKYLSSNSSFHVHFMCRHPYDSCHIIDESSVPLPHCQLCGYQCRFPLFRKHTSSKLCRDGQVTKSNREANQRILQQNDYTFYLDGQPIESTNTFPYLGRIESKTASDWPALYHNLRRARYKWHRLSKLLTREGANPRVFGMFYKAVVQTVLLFGSESWTMTDAMWKVLKGFHHRAVR